MLPLKQGDRIEITCDGKIVTGIVIFGSDNGQSLMIGFDAMLRGHVGMMPVLWSNDHWIDIVTGQELEIRKVRPETDSSGETPSE